jgi:hypothetical protein
MDSPGPLGMQAYYALGKERDRLESGAGFLEYLRTIEIVGRHLPPPPATIADIGGGPGRYTIWLAEVSYRVHHRDLVPLHVEQTADATAEHPTVDTAIGGIVRRRSGV